MAKKVTDAVPSPSTAINTGEEMMGKHPKYKVESAMRTILEAHQHMADPEMMTHVKKLAKSQGSALKAIQSAPPADDEVSEAQDDFQESPSIKKLKTIHAKKFGQKNI